MLDSKGVRDYCAQLIASNAEVLLLNVLRELKLSEIEVLEPLYRLKALSCSLLARVEQRALRAKTLHHYLPLSAKMLRSRIRSLNKKLGQIQSMKLKYSQGLLLNPDQLQKIGQATRLENELRSYQFQLKEVEKLDLEACRDGDTNDYAEGRSVAEKNVSRGVESFVTSSRNASIATISCTRSEEEISGDTRDHNVAPTSSSTPRESNSVPAADSNDDRIKASVNVVGTPNDEGVPAAHDVPTAAAIKDVTESITDNLKSKGVAQKSPAPSSLPLPKPSNVNSQRKRKKKKKVPSYAGDEFDIFNHNDDAAEAPSIPTTPSSAPRRVSESIGSPMTNTPRIWGGRSVQSSPTTSLTSIQNEQELESPSSMPCNSAGRHRRMVSSSTPIPIPMSSRMSAMPSSPSYSASFGSSPSLHDFVPLSRKRWTPVSTSPSPAWGSASPMSQSPQDAPKSLSFIEIQEEQIRSTKVGRNGVAASPPPTCWGLLASQKAKTGSFTEIQSKQAVEELLSPKPVVASPSPVDTKKRPPSSKRSGRNRRHRPRSRKPASTSSSNRCGPAADRSKAGTRMPIRST